ncbi:MAG TPA: metallophosphoesterase [Verrucomicrobiae bacterium]|nr:metallophosphoesterase [Verrucomicrobiae bacterium]
MRVHIISDLHLEFAPFQRNKVDADVVVLAGDAHNGLSGIKWILKNFPEQPVIYVLGNHEFYGHKIPKLISEVKARARGSNVHVLENDAVRIGNVTFLGATLWTDFRLNGELDRADAAAQAGMEDFQQIKVTPSYRRFRPRDARQIHARSLQWLGQQVQAARGKVVVVTHHAPSPQSIPLGFCDHWLNPAFASNLESFIAKSGIKFWIHGHVHSRSDYVVGTTRIVANPRGFRDEITDFDPRLVLKL